MIFSHCRNGVTLMAWGVWVFQTRHILPMWLLLKMLSHVSMDFICVVHGFISICSNGNTHMSFDLGLTSVLDLVARVELRPRRPGLVLTPELAICSKCRVKRQFQGWNIHLFVISSITSTAKTHISGVLVHPKLVQISMLGVKILWNFNFGGISPYFWG